MSEDREDFLLELEQKLCALSVEELLRVCEQCNITEKDNEEIQSKSRRALVKLISQFCEREEFLQREDEGMSVLLELNDVLVLLVEARPAAVGAGVAARSSSSDRAGMTAEAVHEGQLAAARAPPERRTGPRTSLEHQAAQGTSAERQVAMRTSLDSETQRRGRDCIGNSCCSVSSGGFRKDFRISGHVGESTAKDTLSFSSLEHQMESGLKTGYSEAEIVEAVIRAISPGLKLRSYLEGKEDLTLTSLRQVLKAHYAETDATVLYQQLTKATQGANETPLEFLIRVLDLRQKILFASERAQSSLKYNKELVQSQCFQSIRTGLLNDNVRAEMRVYLQDENCSDELLLMKMQTAQYNESERALKAKAHRSFRTGLNVVEQNVALTDPRTNQPDTKPAKTLKDNSLFAKIEESNSAIRELTGQVASLVQTVQRDRSGDSDRQARVYRKSAQRPKRQCSACQQENRDCDHCFKCGSDSHWAKGCKVRGAQKQGNWAGL